MNIFSHTSGVAVVIGARGGIGSALVHQLQQDDWGEVIAIGRDTEPGLDLCDEDSIAAAARAVAARESPLRLVINATGALARYGCIAEKSWKQIDPLAMQRAFALNSIGPALLMKHFLPLLAREGRSTFASLSARVGSIGDNRLGGWYGYRAAKAALNQLVHTAAIELRRSHPEAVCVAIHPGTVATPLTQGFVKTGLEVQTPEVAARRILDVLAGLDATRSGGFFDHKGLPVPW
jgi:NAD(P)-dependent dehydrogenase (short-subunit alcohol dehydrogenase family)